MKKLGIVAAVFVALVAVAAIGLSLLLDANRFKPALEEELSKVLARNVKVGDLQFSLFSGSVSASEMSISEDPGFGSAPFLQAKSLATGVELVPLIMSRKLNVTGITIDSPQITLLQSPAGVWNFSTLGNTKTPSKPAPSSGAASAPLDLSVKSVNIRNARLVLGQAGSKKKPLVLEAVDISVKDFSPNGQFPFSISAKVAGGGDIKLDGKAGPIHAADASMTPFEVTLKIGGLDLAGSGLNSVAPDLAAIVSLDGKGTSDGNTVRVKGDLKAERLKLAPNGTAAKTPVELNFEDEHGLRKVAGTLKSATVHIGKSQATMTGTYSERGDVMDLKLNLNGSNMAATDIAAMLPALGLTLPAGSSVQGGTLNVKLAAEGPADKLVTSGNLALSNFKLAGFNLGQKMETVEKLAGMKSSNDMDVETAATDVRMAPDGIAAQNMQLVVAGFGNVTGQGTISPTNALDFKMVAAVRGNSVTSAIGNLTVPFTITGTGADPVFHPDVKSLAGTEIKKVEGKAVGDLLNGLLGGKKKP
jgi:AsmA protein